MELEFTDRSGRAVPFPSQRFCLGSSGACEVRFPQLQARHLEVHRDASGAWRVRDLSGSGTLKVNGVTALEALLVDGGLVSAGALQLRVRQVDSAGKTEAMPAHVPGQLVVGTVLGERYRIVEWLAEGGMGEVYRAEHLELGKTFAVKVMRPELSHDAEFVARFKREAIASSRIGHQNIVDISDFGRTEAGRFYFVMEFLDGPTLAALMEKDGSMAPARVIHVGLQVARALAAAHGQGILHRDMKPDNVMLLQRPQQPDFVKVVDFGAAKVASDTSGAGQTSIGMVVGTPSYMSPEQAAGLPVDVRTDVYALGLVLYELLVGKATFDALTPSSIQSAHLAGELARLPFIAGLPDTLAGLVEQMVSRRIHERPASMAEVISGLEKCARPAQVETVRVAPPRAARRGPSPDGEGLVTQKQRLPRQSKAAVVARPQPSKRRWPWIVAGLLAAAGAAAGAWLRQ